jgi:hypothetical protein
MPMLFREGHAEKSAHTVRRSRRGQTSSRCELPQPQTALTVALRWEQLNDQDIRPILKERLVNVQNGKTSPTAAPSTKATGPYGNPSQQRIA